MGVASPVTALQLSPAARAALEARAMTTIKNRPNYSAPASSMLERYASLLAAGAATYASDYSEAERMAIRDVLNGTVLDAETIPHLWMELADAAEDGIAEKWGIDLGDLVAKLRGASLIELHAITDDTERFWRSGGRSDG